MATSALNPVAARARSRAYDWLTTTDHKKIGILYLANSFLFFLVGGLLALGVRVELAQPGLQFLTDEHVYNELFTMHGTLMLFLFIIPILAGFGNYGTVAVKEALDVPVVSMAEAAMALATLLCHRFVIVTTHPRMVPYTEDLVRLAGLEARCAGVRAVVLPALDRFVRDEPGVAAAAAVVAGGPPACDVRRVLVGDSH